MFDWLLMPENHAISILKKDHQRVKDLFFEFERAKTPAAKERILAHALTELKIHAIIEEEIFYPAVRKHVGAKVMNEADEEHHVAKLLVAELDHKRKNGHRDAKFLVLAENVRHHIREEESEMLPKAKNLKLDFEALGEQMLQRKDELLKAGIPESTERALVSDRGADSGSPAARKTPARAQAPKAKSSVGSKRAAAGE